MLRLGNAEFRSRLILGTAGYPSPAVMREAIKASECQMITVSLRRESSLGQGSSPFWDYVKDLGLKVLPNTAGCSGAKEAVTVAQMSREVFNTNWIKLEVVGDEWSLQPDPWGTVEAAEKLIKLGFEVFPYITEDIVVAQKLVDLGCQILMPWGSPIGSGLGIANPLALQRMRSKFPNVTMIVDAGIGKPSHATQAMELGVDAVILNTAVSQAGNPVTMAKAFRHAVEAGRLGYEGELVAVVPFARASTPTLGRPFEMETE